MSGTINDNQLFKQAFNNNAMTLQLKQHLLDDIIEKLNSTIHNLRDFETFFDWRNHIADFSEKEAKMINALIKVRPKNWLAAFDTWYFHNLLVKEGSKYASFESLLANYFNEYENLKKETPTFIQTTWQLHRSQALTATKSSEKRNLNAFDKRQSSHAQNVCFTTRSGSKTHRRECQ